MRRVADPLAFQRLEDSITLAVIGEPFGRG